LTWRPTISATDLATETDRLEQAARAPAEGTVKLLGALLLSSVALVFPTAASAQSANVSKIDQTYTIFDPCTNEDVLVTITRVYLSYHGGDQSHTAAGTGVGVTTGTVYVFTEEAFDIRGLGGLDIIHLVAPGPEPDLTITDDPFDVIDPVVICT
jgi:hypothetical protein